MPVVRQLIGWDSHRATGLGYIRISLSILEGLFASRALHNRCRTKDDDNSTDTEAMDYDDRPAQKR